MKQLNNFSKLFIFFSFTIVTIIACSKGSDSPATPAGPVDVCAGKTLTLSTAVVNALNACAKGSITITAGGSTGFTYNIDNGTFQASNAFSNVSVGDHGVIIKDAAGCTKSANVTVASNAGSAGPLFTGVKNLIAASCLSCHSGASASGGKSFSSDCDIVNSADRIKVRTIDGTPSFMPQGGQLSAADKKKVSDWIAAGAKFSD